MNEYSDKSKAIDERVSRAGDTPPRRRGRSGFSMARSGQIVTAFGPAGVSREAAVVSTTGRRAVRPLLQTPKQQE
jgi:hypothetical protein